MLRLTGWTITEFRRWLTMTDGAHEVAITMTQEDADSPDALEIFRMKLNAALEQTEKQNEHGNRS